MRGGTRRVQLVRGRDETCPLSTGGGMRRVQLVGVIRAARRRCLPPRRRVGGRRRARASRSFPGLVRDRGARWKNGRWRRGGAGSGARGTRGMGKSRREGGGGARLPELVRGAVQRLRLRRAGGAASGPPPNQPQRPPQDCRAVSQGALAPASPPRPPRLAERPIPAARARHRRGSRRPPPARPRARRRPPSAGCGRR